MVLLTHHKVSSDLIVLLPFSFHKYTNRKNNGFLTKHYLGSSQQTTQSLIGKRFYAGAVQMNLTNFEHSSVGHLKLVRFGLQLECHSDSNLTLQDVIE